MNSLLVSKIKDMFSAEAIFPYGSAVYKNKTPDDYDFIIVSSETFQKKLVIDGLDCEISSYTKADFLQKLEEHDIAILECLFINHEHFINEIQETKSFKINLSKLREGISQKSSNSYVKAKKKLIIQDDFNEQVSLKSLWHSLRIADYGRQLSIFGFINEKESMNAYYDEINKDYAVFENDWSLIHTKYKPIHNAIMSVFRAQCPKK